MSKALATMAILKANWDEHRDYLSNFQPVVDDVLRAWPAGRPIEPGDVAGQLKTNWGLDVPYSTVATMIRRAERSGLARRLEGTPQLFTPPEATVLIADLAAASEVGHEDSPHRFWLRRHGEAQP